MSSQVLVRCEWLKDQLDKPGVRIVDGNWGPQRDTDQEFLQQHIKGTVRFNIATVCNTEAPLPITIPTAKQFEDYVEKMGISSSDHVVVYDNNSTFGLYSGARVLWIFQTYGHENVSLLDGGLPKWIAAGYPTIAGPPPVFPATTYKATFQPDLFHDFEQMLDNFTTKKEQVVDARPKTLYDNGHIMGAINLPFSEVVNKDTMTLKNSTELRKVFESHGVNVDEPLVTSCQGGVVSPLLAFSVYVTNGRRVPVYDGSWSEWVKKAPKEKMHGVK